MCGETSCQKAVNTLRNLGEETSVIYPWAYSCFVSQKQDAVQVEGISVTGKQVDGDEGKSGVEGL